VLDEQPLKENYQDLVSFAIQNWTDNHGAHDWNIYTRMKLRLKPAMWCFRLHLALSEPRDWWTILVGTLIPASLNAIGLRLPVGECHHMTSRPRGASCAVPWTTGSGTAHTVEKGPIMDTVNSMALGATAEVN
jgi:hypothetical protein